MHLMTAFKEFADAFNLKKHCRQYKVDLWQCPHFIFVLMGAIIIGTIIITYYVGQLYVDPFIITAIVLGVTILLFILSYIVINSFERIAQASKEKSEFISIMSHQLRSPLSFVKWQTDMLLSSKEPVNPEEDKKAIFSISEHNDLMIRLLNELLEIHRLENDSVVLRPEVFSLVDLMRELVEKYANRATSNEVNILFFPPEKDIKVMADKIKISSAAAHLLDNAIRYSSNGEKVTVSLEAAERRARCSISDEGVGIPEKDTRKIFKKYFRGEGSARYKTDGLGAGLYISKRIIESSGGRMGFSSIEGKGSNFWFSLPLSE